MERIVDRSRGVFVPFVALKFSSILNDATREDNIQEHIRTCVERAYFFNWVVSTEIKNMDDGIPLFDFKRL